MRLNEIEMFDVMIMLNMLVLYMTPPHPVALRPNAGHGLLILEVPRLHTTTHHSR